MAFDLMIETKFDGQFTWFNLPESDRAAMQQLRDEFNLVQVDLSKRLIIEGRTTTFDKPWSQITGITIAG